jgi:hypothetical protein
MKTLAANARYGLGDTPGFFGVLHTWGRTLEYHPPHPLRRPRRSARS